MTVLLLELLREFVRRGIVLDELALSEELERVFVRLVDHCHERMDAELESNPLGSADQALLEAAVLVLLLDLRIVDEDHESALLLLEFEVQEADGIAVGKRDDVVRVAVEKGGPLLDFIPRIRLIPDVAHVLDEEVEHPVRVF